MFAPNELISRKYVVMQRLLHAQPDGYGENGDKWAETVRALLADHEATSVLDYGCGQGALKHALQSSGLGLVRFSEYDPAIPGKDDRPEFADLVVCTDVLEHIEPDKLEAVLNHLKQLARRAVFVVIALVPTAKVLADGRNAHLIVRPANWWKKRVQAAGFAVHRAPSCARKKKSHEWVAVLTP